MLKAGGDWKKPVSVFSLFLVTLRQLAYTIVFVTRLKVISIWEVCRCIEFNRALHKPSIVSGNRRLVHMATSVAAEKADKSAENQGKPGVEAIVPSPNEQKPSAKKTELAILNFVIKYLKLVGGALLIWFMGWFGLSYVWIICGFFVYVLWRMNQDERKTRRQAFREAVEREQEVVEARMEDLPSWVRYVSRKMSAYLLCFQPFWAKDSLLFLDRSRRLSHQQNCDLKLT